MKTPDGYQGVVLLSNSGNALWALRGECEVVVNGGNDSIFAGDGNVSIIGGVGDTIVGATGAPHRTDDGGWETDLHGRVEGNQSIIGGNVLIYGGSGKAWING